MPRIFLCTWFRNAYLHRREYAQFPATTLRDLLNFSLVKNIPRPEPSRVKISAMAKLNSAPLYPVNLSGGRIPVNLLLNKTPEGKFQIARVNKPGGPQEGDFDVLKELNTHVNVQNSRFGLAWPSTLCYSGMIDSACLV